MSALKASGISSTCKMGEDMKLSEKIELIISLIEACSRFPSAKHANEGELGKTHSGMEERY